MRALHQAVHAASASSLGFPPTAHPTPAASYLHPSFLSQPHPPTLNISTLKSPLLLSFPSCCSLAALAGKKSDNKVSAASILEAEEYESKYEPKYEAPKKAYKGESKYEKEDEYYPEPKYEKKGYAPKYGYAKEKVSVKLYEKFRSHLRPQPGNVNTFQFT